jgi:molybdenum cofactor biosynthesis enzyme MoaA
MVLMGKGDYMAFQKAYIDISGYCNAKCRWCVTHNNRNIKAQKGFLSPGDLNRILDRLTDIGALDGSTQIGLHNWGEPTLNKDFPGISGILSKNKFPWWYSTNASVFPNAQECDFSSLTSLLISMPGFSQSSYDKIHGFKFDDIKKNIENYVNFFKGAKPIQIAYHVYQFNIQEIPYAHEYVSKLKINFMPSYAYFNNYDLAIKYLNYKLSSEDLYDASTQLVLFYARELVAKQPRNYVCPQLSFLALDEFGNVLQCCGIARTQNHYSIGSIFDLTLDEIIEKREKSPACLPCLNSGAIYWGANPLMFRYK